jgi:hypothetical protein
MPTASTAKTSSLPKENISSIVFAKVFYLGVSIDHFIIAKIGFVSIERCCL